MSNCDTPKEKSFLTALPSGYTKVTFSNDIHENDSVNILTYEYIYNGGGIGAGDFNNDGLPDIYFSGNMVDNKLYLNQGQMQFIDITEKAKVAAHEKWSTGISTIDINNDGWLDIYVCSSGPYNFYDKQNLLFVNLGADDKGIPHFEEKGKDFGLNDNGPTVQAVFLDYDKDGDLDVYLLNNVQKNKVPANKVVPKQNDGTAVNNDKLYRNNLVEKGKISFTDVSKEAGIIKEGYGLGIAVQDINKDGWPDIYISNDYISNDILYINNQDGTFTDHISSMFKHQSHSAMGNDIGDINNDGMVDVMTLDMLPADNKGRKLMLPGGDYNQYLFQIRYNYDPQYMRNTLQLNNGITPTGLPVFSEIGQFSGVFETNWSWSPLLIDLDNDGSKDLFVTNGYPKDITNHDFSDYRHKDGKFLFKSYVEINRELLKALDKFPSLKVPNKVFRNNGDLTFTDMSEKWGLVEPTFSHGAAFADFDLDGDLDVVINNMNDEAQFLENTLYQPKIPEDIQPTTERNNYLRISLDGPSNNLTGLGTKIRLKNNGTEQYYEHSPYRGYQSTVENVIHFGVGVNDVIDTLEITWPDGRYQCITQIKTNQKVNINYDEATFPKLKKSKNIQLFRNVADSLHINYRHKEETYIDFRNQALLPHMHSQKGPGIAVGDVNGDNLEDFFVGGAFKHSGHLFIQQTDGSFSNTPITNATKYEEDMGCLLFDADNDQDLDLYIVSGSSEFDKGSDYYQDRLLINDGKGNFEVKPDALPALTVSGSCVTAADFDNDGDLDLFIGGMLTPNQYPSPAQSFILRNDTQLQDHPVFIDVTKEVAPGLLDLGMVCSSLWTDFNNDGQIDLMVTGEWMPITFLQNDNGHFTNITARMPGNMSDYTGWWNSLVAGDFDNDGDTDYVAGNLGANSKLKASRDYPIYMYAKDFDSNGSIDPVMAYPLNGEYYPLNSRNKLATQLVMIKKRFLTHTAYAEAKFSDLFSQKELAGCMVLDCKYFLSSYLENTGIGPDGFPSFKVKPLPSRAQFAPVQGMHVLDFDEDGNLDIVLVGNSYTSDPELGRYDALQGLCLTGNGNGGFHSISFKKSGFLVGGDSKGLAELVMKGGNSLLLASQNNDRLQAHLQGYSKFKVYQAGYMDSFALITMMDGTKRKHEFYYGDSYLSHSSRSLKYNPNNVRRIDIYDYNGNIMTMGSKNNKK